MFTNSERFPSIGLTHGFPPIGLTERREYRDPKWPEIKVRCLLAFIGLEGVRVDPGQEVTLPKPLADDLLARKRVELIT